MRVRLLVVALVAVLALASSASAGCAWVVWVKISGHEWAALGAEATQDKCEIAAEFLTNKYARSDAGSKLNVQSTCLPDTVDPRAPKAAGR